MQRVDVDLPGSQQAVAHHQDAHASPSYPRSIENAVGPEELEAPDTAQSATSAFSEVAALCPIGAFDSGFGGLSVVADMRRLLPYEDILYFGDNANCPYGGRTDDWLRARSLEIAGFLMERGAKAIVVACNTASAAGLEHLRATYPLPIIGLVPAVKPAVAATRTGVVAVLATRATMRGRLLADVIAQFADPSAVEVVTVVPEGWVEAVEAGRLQAPETAEAVRRAVAPMMERGADAIVLGSTHYPFLKPLVRQIVGEGVHLVDSGEGVARQTRRVLQSRHLLRPAGSQDTSGTLTVYTSADPDAMRPIVWRLVGEEVPVLPGNQSGPDAGLAFSPDKQ